MKDKDVEMNGEVLVLGCQYKQPSYTSKWYGLLSIIHRSDFGFLACVDVIDGRWWAGVRGNLEMTPQSKSFDTFEEAAEHAKKLFLQEYPNAIICQSKEEEEKWLLLM